MGSDIKIITTSRLPGEDDATYAQRLRDLMDSADTAPTVEEMQENINATA